MTPTDRIEEAPGQARIVPRSDVLVVGSGPSGLAAAIAARREGCSVTLVERYAYLGGLASGGMVLVLDDMHNGDEVTVQGICMEMIERMAHVGAAVYPPPEDRRQGWDVYDKWARWGAFDFRSHLKPAPIVMAAAFDPDGWKRISNEMLAEAGVDVRLHSWFSRAIVKDGRIRGVICETKAGREAMLGGVVIDTTGDLDVAAAAGAKFKEGRYIVSTVFRLGGVDTDEAERFREEEPEAYAQIDRQAKRVIGGSWNYWWLKTPLPGVVWCNCPHMTGFDALKVEDLTRADFEGRKRIYAFVDFVRANLPGFHNTFVVDGRAAARRAHDPAAPRRVRRHQGGRARAGPFRRHRGARARLLHALRGDAAEGGRRSARRRPALFGDRVGAEAIARDPALHVDGPIGGSCGGARACRRHPGQARRSTRDLRAGARPGRRPGGHPIRQRQGHGECRVTAPTELPLAGVKVVDFTQVMMGPVATQVLGDFGTDVIKIERPPTGDLSRTSFPNDPAGLTGPVYCSLNRNKRSIVLDTRKEADKDAVLRLLDAADVVVNNFRAGVMERMGFGYDMLSKRNPRLIYAVGTGFGLTGPYAHKGGQDVLAQAMSGVMARRSDAALPLSVYSTTFADYSAGMHLVQGVLLALLQRQKTGRGQLVSVSLLDSMLAAQTQEAAAFMIRGREVNWGAMPLTGVFETLDGALVMVGAFKADPLRDIGTALDLPALHEDGRFRDHAAQVANKAALHGIFRERFRTGTTAHWIARLEAQDLLCAPVRTLGEALGDEQTRVNGMILETENRVETVRVVGSPVHLSDAAVSVRIPPAELGQHTAEVLAEIGGARTEKVA